MGICRYKEKGKRKKEKGKKDKKIASLRSQ
jgi:hypothetical protein